MDNTIYGSTCYCNNPRFCEKITIPDSPVYPGRIAINPGECDLINSKNSCEGFEIHE
jgi:hypothetical protein